MKPKTRLLVLLLVIALALSLPGLSAFAADPTLKNRPENDLWMKIGVDRALSRGEKVSCAAPFSADGGQSMVPLDLVAAYRDAGVACSGGQLSVTSQAGSPLFTADLAAHGILLRDGVPFAPLAEAAALFDLNFYESPLMGMLALSETGLTYDETLVDDQQTIFDLSARFVLEMPTAEEFVADVQNGAGLETHPRLMVTQDRFDELRRIYRAEGLTGEELRLQRWITSFMAEAEAHFSRLFKQEGLTVEWIDEETKLSYRQPYIVYDENGAPLLPDVVGGLYTRGDVPDRLIGDPLRTYVFDKNTQLATYTLYNNASHDEVVYTMSAYYGDGYDDRETLNESWDWDQWLEHFAFGWQMTGEQKWADAYYLFAVQIGSWTTWGDGHFLDVADAAMSYSLAYDWIYHAFDDEPAKRREIVGYLYDHIIPSAYHAHINFAGGHSKKHTPIVGEYIRMSDTRLGGCFFDYRINNWNFVCTNGVILAALCTIEVPEYRKLSATTAEWVLSTFQRAMVEYAPDGAYREGPGYWGYATFTFYHMVGGLVASTGKDYGLMDSIGMADTCYYFFNIANNAGDVWPYHDCERGEGKPWCFSFAANYYQNSDFLSYRLSSIDSGSAVDILDILYFDPALVSDAKAAPKLYFMRGSDIVTMRSGLDTRATFTGLHAGPTMSDHTDLDAGNFILEMGGVRWIDDSSSEDYNLPDYNLVNLDPEGIRFYYFRKTAEAHATVMILSQSPDVVNHGQVMSSYQTPYAKIVKAEETSHGALAVADMTPQYGACCTLGKRAVMMTADGAAVVVQDKISFSDVNAGFLWNLPVTDKKIKVTVADDGRSATLTKNGVTLRCSILSSYKKLTFRYLPAGADPLLPKTISQNSPANFDARGNKLYPLVKDTWQRLYIEGSTLHDFQLAVVFQVVKTGNEPVYYDLVDIDEMTPVALSEFVPTDPGEFDDDADVLPEDLLAAIASPPRYHEDDPIGYLQKIADIAALADRLNPENPGTANAKRRLSVFLSDISDRIDSINGAIRSVERARKKLPLPLG